MKDFTCTLNIDSTLLKEDMTLEQLLLFNAFKQDQFRFVNRPRKGNTDSVVSLKDKTIANMIIKLFMDMYGSNMHVTSISTPDSMEVRLSH